MGYYLWSGEFWMMLWRRRSNLFLSFQEMVQAKDPPSHYLTKLRTYLDPKASRSHRVSFERLIFFIINAEIIKVQINSCARESREKWFHKNSPSQTMFGHDINLRACMFCLSVDVERRKTFDRNHHNIKKLRNSLGAVSKCDRAIVK